MVPTGKIIISVLVMAVITFLTRLFPFLFFRKKRPPELVRFTQIYIPPMVMMILVMYCLVDVKWAAVPYGIPELICVALVFILHVWKRNAFISIFAGTGLYMALIQTGIIETLF